VQAGSLRNEVDRQDACPTTGSTIVNGLITGVTTIP